MDATKAVGVERAARKMDRALKLLVQARDELNALGAYEDDDLFLATSGLTDAIAETSTAFTSTRMAAYVWLQEAQRHQAGVR